MTIIEQERPGQKRVGGVEHGAELVYAPKSSLLSPRDAPAQCKIQISQLNPFVPRGLRAANAIPVGADVRTCAPGTAQEVAAKRIFPERSGTSARTILPEQLRNRKISGDHANAMMRCFPNEIALALTPMRAQKTPVFTSDRNDFSSEFPAPQDLPRLTRETGGGVKLLIFEVNLFCISIPAPTAHCLLVGLLR